MFLLNGTLKKSGSVGRWEMKQFIGMALLFLCKFFQQVQNPPTHISWPTEEGSLYTLLMTGM